MDTSGDISWFAERHRTVQRSIQSFIQGKPDAVRAALTCLFSGGHLLVEDVPGVGKTSLARALARSIDVTVGRIQFTPDLLPSDVTGVQVYEMSTGRFRFQPGPIFAHIVLADEVNRASPKTQSALLEVMEERQVTTDGTTRSLAEPFIVVATSNPIEHAGVYRLPEAQLDRFLMRIELGYPSPDAEEGVIRNHLAGATTEDLTPVLSLDDVRSMIAIARSVEVGRPIERYVVQLLNATRNHERIDLGASPRAGVQLAVAARSRAAADARSYVTVDDIKELAPLVLAHRLVLAPDASREPASAAEILRGILRGLPVPQAQPT